MGRATIRAASQFLAALTLVLLLVAAPARGQALPSKKELTKWVENAEKSSSLLSEDLPPYHFVANVRYTLGTDTAPLEGTFEVLWAAPDRYRVEFRLGKIGETDLVLGDKKYVLRNTPTMTLAMWNVSAFLFSRIPPGGSGPGESVNNIASVGDGASREICATAGDTSSFKREFCFDANVPELVSRHTHPNPHGAMPGSTFSVDLTDYITLGKLRYPRHLTRQSGPERIEATVQRLEAVQNFSDDLFAPLPNATVWDWCFAPEIRTPKSNSTPLYGPFVSDSPIGTFAIPYVAFYKIVGVDGTPRRVTQLFGPPEKSARTFFDRERHEKSSAHLCDGKPIEYETVFLYWPLGFSRQTTSLH
jgi:hypothetical protein